MVILLQWFKPLESTLANNLETFNEILTLALLYQVMLFSNFQPDLDMREGIGHFTIGMISFHALVHLFFMLQQSCIDMRMSARSRL